MLLRSDRPRGGLVAAAMFFVSLMLVIASTSTFEIESFTELESCIREPVDNLEIEIA